MRTRSPLWSLWTVFFVLMGLAAAGVQPALGFRVICYNLLNYGGGSDRLAYYRTVTDSLDADIVVVQEITSQTAVNYFLANILNYNSPGAYKAMPFSNGPDTDNACFYKWAALDSIFCQQISTPIRLTSEYVFRPDGYESSAAEFRILSTHLKAGDSSSDEQDRLAMTNVIRDYLNGLPSGSNFMVMGDLNVYTCTDQGYQRLIRSETDNDGRNKDPINKQGAWHDNYTFAATHTQSSRTTEFGGGASGGMDDRFDQILISYALDDGDGLSYVPASYFAFGNDGYRLNASVNAMPNFVVSQAVADAIYYASDHVPVVASFQLPAKADAPSAVAFGTWAVGSTATRTLNVTNAAASPADELSYSLAAPAGFSAPGGTFVAGAGSGNAHTLGMSTSAPCSPYGTLTVNSNDLDHPALDVSLSGTVVGHAVPSLSPAAVVLVDTIDFGARLSTEFPDLDFCVHDFGYTSLQALLEVYDASIVGGGGLFFFCGGFVPKEAGASPATYTVGFDADAAIENTLYTATLTLETRDDTEVQGGTALCDLVIHLSAFVLPGSGVDDTPAAVSLGPVRPNPASHGASAALALPAAAEVSVGVYDAAGRLVKVIADGPFGPGEHELAWDGRDEAGRNAASGVYFMRAKIGEQRASRKLVLMRE